MNVFNENTRQNTIKLYFSTTVQSWPKIVELQVQSNFTYSVANKIPIPFKGCIRNWVEVQMVY